MKINTLIFCTFSVLFIASCSKEKNNNWVIANITTVDADTKNGIPAEIKLEWRNERDVEAGIQTIEYGNSSDSGIKNIEEKLKGKPVLVEIKARAFKYYEPPYVNELNFLRESVDLKITNSIQFEFAPVYLYKFHFNAINCFDTTDSLVYTVIYRPSVEEYTQTEPVTLYGCADEIMPLGAAYDNALYSFEDEVTLKYDVYRNGAHTNNTIVFPLIKNQENLIEVEY